MRIKHSIKLAFNQIPSLRCGAERAWFLLVCLLRLLMGSSAHGPGGRRQGPGGTGDQASPSTCEIWALAPAQWTK